MKNQFFKYHLLVVCTMVVTIISSFNANAQQSTSGQEIKFTTKTYKEVLAAAKTSHKKIFVDAFATWCSPCKELHKTTFKDAKAAPYFNKRFINYTVDVEKGEGIGLAKTWQVESLPTLLIIDENGKVIANHTGYIDGKGLMQFAQEAAESAQPKNRKGASNK
ncbi:thioredoxin family protein [Pedobacter hartonius]|uniref:Thioredoxin n=1 Tax=Pedobacter hartonius TaxID=425514 RepID=A0A1H3WQ49_9SPHI|nr:thioredoxin domain-containing protein [Pedobacter hartonius]SDZ88901.1 Thioredoxin [Pedobacter hartonius]